MSRQPEVAGGQRDLIGGGRSLESFPVRRQAAGKQACPRHLGVARQYAEASLPLDLEVLGEDGLNDHVPRVKPHAVEDQNPQPAHTLPKTNTVHLILEPIS